jgi:hypothetical protein
MAARSISLGVSTNLDCGLPGRRSSKRLKFVLHLGKFVVLKKVCGVFKSLWCTCEKFVLEDSKVCGHTDEFVFGSRKVCCRLELRGVDHTKLPLTSRLGHIS